MTQNELLDAIAKMGTPQPGVPQVPTPELVALWVRWVRGMRQLKQSTLADFANVSLSTVERVERAERVNKENLDRIAVALGFKPGYFTTPRLPVSTEDVVETWGNLESVRVRPLCNQNAVRQIANCHGFLLYPANVDKAHEDCVSELGEWLQALSFLIGSSSMADVREGRKRKIYEGVLGCVRQLRHRDLCVLGGVMDAPQPGIPEWRVAIITITSREADPGALKRRHILVDRRCAEPEVYWPCNDPDALVFEFAKAIGTSAIIGEGVVYGEKRRASSPR